MRFKGSGGPFREDDMKTLLLIAALLATSCGLERKALSEDKVPMACRYAQAWDFQRCENDEVVCYANKVGLSCTWK